MIFGIGGKARAGKGSIAKVFIKDYNFIEINFADSLKSYCSQTFNLPLNTFNDDNLKDSPISEHLTIDVLKRFLDVIEEDGGIPTSHIDLASIALIEFTSPRHILQHMGTEIARKLVCDDVWIRIFKSKVNESERHIVCSDVRFPNEVNAIKELGGHALYVSRPSVEDAVRGHSSEQLTSDSFDVIIDNSGDLLNTQSDVRMWISRRFPGGLR